MRKRRKDYKNPSIGKKFNKLTIIKALDDGSCDKKSGCRIPLLCKCECGEYTISDRWSVESGHKKMCERCSTNYKNSNVSGDVRKTQKNNTTGYKGIDINNGKFRARYYFKNNVLFSKNYETYEEALAARQAIENVMFKLKKEMK